MTARSWVRLMVFIGICAIKIVFLPEPGFIGFISAAQAQSLQQEGPVVDQIARLRSEVESEQELQRLNDALFWLVRNYDDTALFALLKDSHPSWVIARGEVESHLRRLALAKQALRLRFGSNDLVTEMTANLSEDEIIALAAVP